VDPAAKTISQAIPTIARTTAARRNLLKSFKELLRLIGDTTHKVGDYLRGFSRRRPRTSVLALS
jgi:hypothetical protein